MASNAGLQFVMQDLVLKKESSNQIYTIKCPKDLHLKVCADTSGVLADLMYKKVVEKFTVDGIPQQKSLTFMESLLLLSEMNLLSGVIEKARNTPKLTINAQKTKFDKISKTAYANELADGELTAICNMAPSSFNPHQKVRFMEEVAASMPPTKLDDTSRNVGCHTASPIVDHDSTRNVGKRMITTKSHTPSPIVHHDATRNVIPTNSQQLPINIPHPETFQSMDSCGQSKIYWSHKATLLLIEKRREYDSSFTSSCITKKQAWQKVTNDLVEKGQLMSNDDCSNKFRGLKSRYKIVKDKNSQTGNSRQTWPYYNVLDDFFAGDPAVSPSIVVASMPSKTAKKTGTSNINSLPNLENSSETVSIGAEDENNNVVPQPGLEDQNNNVPPPPKPTRKRRRSSLDADEAPQWFKLYQESQERMHTERMALETRRVNALEHLVQIIQQKQ